VPRIRVLRKLAKYLSYTLAALIILAAVAVGLLRIMLPQLPEYQDEIEARVTAAIGRQVSFSRLDARWRLRGPEIVFYDVSIADSARPGSTLVDASSVTVGVSATDLLARRRLRVRRINVDEIDIVVDRLPSGDWSVQGQMLPATGSWGDLLVRAPADLPVGRNVSISLSDIRVRLTDQLRGAAAVTFDVQRLTLDLAGEGVSAQGRVVFGGGNSGRLSVDVTGRFGERSAAGVLSGDWQVNTALRDVVFGDFADIAPAGWHIPVRGTGDATVALDIRSGGVRSSLVTFDLSGLSPPGATDLADVAGRVEWQTLPGGWLVSVDDLDLRRAERDWPRTFLRLRANVADGRRRLEFGVGPVPLEDLGFFARFGPDAWSGPLAALALGGDLVSASGSIAGVVPGTAGEAQRLPVDEYEIDAEVDGLAMAPVGIAPGVRGLTGVLRATPQSGRFELASTDLGLRLPALFSAEVPLGQTNATIVWRQSGRGLSILSDRIEQASGTLKTASSLELQLPNDGGSARIDLSSDWSIDDVAAIEPYLPDGVIKPKLRDWLSDALVAGSVEDGRFLFSGELAQFPFANGEGSFAATANARGVTMRFAKTWPEITDLDARIELDGLRLFTTDNRGRTGGIPFADAAVEVPDLTAADIRVRNEEPMSLADLLQYAGDSPLRRIFGSQFERLRVSGEAQTSLDLRVPLKDIRAYEVDATLSTESATVALAGLDQSLSELNGAVAITREGVTGSGLTGRLLGEPVRIDINPITVPDSPYRTQVTAAGNMTDRALVDELGLPFAGEISGAAPYTAVVRFPRASPGTAPETATPVSVRIDSTLAGMALTLPYPASKAADEQAAIALEFALGKTISFGANLNRIVDVDGLLDRASAEERWRLDRATVHVGPGAALLSVVPGIFIDGRIDRLRLNDWLALVARLRGDNPTVGLQTAALRVGRLFAFGQRVDDVSVSVNRAAQDWLVQLQSAAITGAISIPVDLSDGRPVILEMERLRLLESDPDAAGPGDPASYPPLIVRADQFDLGERAFGKISATIEKTADGLIASELSTSAPEFNIAGVGRWTQSAVDPAGSRTEITLRVESSDVSGMMDRLGYSPGINASDLEATVDVSWSGGPRADFLASLDGAVSMRIAEGRLDEVEPGAGRVVGLMSVAALPRRLALDFRDVFRKGLTFDEISGDFRIVNGEAYTCNTSLKSSVADIGLIGRASLVRRNYNQTAIVSANVGNTLPAVGAVVAGPQAAAALLLFSQIFKKPLQGIGQAYYQINGSWDEPSIDRTDPERFDATSQMAGCLIDINE
jgi:uncharacterized protein (TIGR02099 family)